jgi:hypothetical protein
MIRMLNGLVLVLLFTHSSMAWEGSQALESGLDSQNILFFEDFEAPDYKNNWHVHWNRPVGAGIVTGPDGYVFAGKRSAYLQSLGGQHKAVGAGEYVPLAPIDDVIYVRLYLRLDDDFSMGTANQLKLFGIRGGATLKDTYGGAGKRPTGNNKFSTTLAIDKWNELHLYTYHMEQRGGYGEWLYCDGLFCGPELSAGKWHCVEVMLKANTPGMDNGKAKAWLDGGLVISEDGLQFRNNQAVKIRRFSIIDYFGGGGARNTSPRDQRIYIDNYVISKTPIGCLKPAGSSQETAQ